VDPEQHLQRCEIRESGLIYFFYRRKTKVKKAPKEVVSDPRLIGRLYILLAPGATDRNSLESPNTLKRILVAGRKKMPNLDMREKSFCQVKLVTTSIAEITRFLGPHIHKDQEIPAAQPCGEGVYGFLDCQADAHLAYALTLPQEPGEVQRFFNIEKEGSYILGVHTEELPRGFRRVGEAVSLLEKPFFKHRRYIKPTIEHLNTKGTALDLMGLPRKLEKHGESGTELKRAAMEDAKKHVDDKLFGELRILKETFKITPLVSGKWA